MTELIRRIDPRLFSTHVVALSGRGSLRSRVEGVRPITEFRITSLKSVGTFRQILRFAWWLRAHDIHVVQACDFYANVFALPGAALAGVPVRLGARRDVFMPERTPGQQHLQRLAYRLAHRVVANSDAAVRRLVDEGVAASRIVHIANGIDFTAFAAVSGAGPSHAASSGRRVITTVANLRPGKGHDVLLKAAARVLRRIPDVQFRIVGDGPRRQELEQQAAALRISAQVSFLGHRDDVPAVLRQSDIFAFPSFMEASPNALIEAMAAGLPIVATRVGGIPEVIEHERTGVLVPPGDDRALAAGIVRLIDRPELALRVGESARRLVQARFSFERMVGEFQELFVRELSARVAPEVLTWAASPGN
jgi:glycosyltransferase involved in cell wall biosynthesis